MSVKAKFLIPVLMFFISVSHAGAQTASPSNADARIMNYHILNAVDEYGRTSTLYNNSYKQDFLRLFINTGQECIYDDIMNSSMYRSMVSPKDYVNQFDTDGDVLLETDIKDFRYAGPFEFKNGKWYRKVEFSKSMRIIDSRYYYDGAGGVLYDMEHFYPGVPNKMVMELAYDKERNRCFICSVDIVSPKPSSPIDNEKYSVIVKSGTKYDDRLLSEGGTLVYNEFDEAFIDYNKYSLKDEDVKIVPKELALCDNYNVIKLKFTPKHFRLKARASFAPFGAYHVDKTSPEINSKTSAIEFGVDLGYMFSAGKSRIGIFTGAAVSKSKLSFGAKELSYKYPGYITDFSEGFGGGISYVNDDYIREYHIKRATEGLDNIHFMVPLYVDFEQKISNLVNVGFSVGVKNYFNCSTSYTPYSIVGESSDGRYVDFLDWTVSSFRHPVDFSNKPVDISVFGNIGIDVKLVSDLFLNISAGYEYGLTWLYRSAGNIYFSEEDNIFPVVYWGEQRKDIAERSFLDCISYKRQGIWLSFGLKYKF